MIAGNCIIIKKLDFSLPCSEILVRCLSQPMNALKIILQLDVFLAGTGELQEGGKVEEFVYFLSDKCMYIK